MTNPQPLEALKKANRIRLGRVEVWQRLRDLEQLPGLLAVADLMERPPETILTATVFEMLRQPHNMGKSRARRMLTRAGMTELTTVAGATERQRAALRADLRVVA